MLNIIIINIRVGSLKYYQSQILLIMKINIKKNMKI